MRSIVKRIYEHSIDTPCKTAIIATDCNVDYITLWKLITNVCALLKQKGVKKQERVMLEASPTVEYLACCYGIHLLGAIHVPFEKGAPQSRIEDISKEINPIIILRGKHPLVDLETSLNDLMLKDEVSGYEFPGESMIQEILFTTGTTGKSKGVMITHYGQMNMCESQNSVIDFSVDNVWMIPTPLNHAAGLRKIHMSMVRGSTVLLMDGFKNLKLFFSNMKEYGVTSLYLPPAGVHYILMLAGKTLSQFDEQLDFLYSSSSALPGGDKEKLIELLPNVRKFDAYGGSEVGAVVYIDYNAVQGDGRCVGKPNPGVDVFIVDEEYKPIISSEENPGIIAIRSNTVTAGYWNEPELTAQTIKDGVIYMSDLGYIDDKGYLYLIGRRDDVINVGGLKVAPTEVEDVAQRFERIKECVCVPYESEKMGKTIKMFVVMKEDNDFDAEEIASFLEKNLEDYKVPKYFEQIEEIPKTYNGKIDRKKLISIK